MKTNLKCPCCLNEGDKIVRLKRSFFLKLIISSKFLKCRNCYSKYLIIPYLKQKFIFKDGYSINSPENSLVDQKL